MNIDVIDNLKSSDPTAALSANQGRVLYNMINNVASDSDIDAIFN